MGAPTSGSKSAHGRAVARPISSPLGSADAQRIDLHSERTQELGVSTHAARHTFFAFSLPTADGLTPSVKKVPVRRAVPASNVTLMVPSSSMLTLVGSRRRPSSEG